jgi:hypothetical protein
MKKLLTAAAVVASLGVALPAAAQTWGGGYGGGYRVDSFGDRNIENRIDHGVRNGSLSPREARSLSRELNDIRQLERVYSRDGVSSREARELDRRYAALTARLRAELRDRDNRFGDYGRGYDRDYGRNGYGYR